jgi:hypothetical protein
MLGMYKNCMQNVFRILKIIKNNLSKKKKMISYCVFPRKVVVTMPSKVQTKNRDLFNLLQAKPLKFNPKTFEEDHTPFCLSTQNLANWSNYQKLKIF